jgi:hypothetical protein
MLGGSYSSFRMAESIHEQTMTHNPLRPARFSHRQPPGEWGQTPGFIETAEDPNLPPCYKVERRRTTGIIGQAGELDLVEASRVPWANSATLVINPQI